MRINHNISALNTYRQLTNNVSASSKSLEKLSSGYRINRAGDDAAGLAISEKMRGQIRGLDMASKNAQDGISMIQTAEGALNEVHSILQRMRELAVQAANGTNTDDDRKALQNEISQLNAEIDRIGNTTEFNTMKLLNGEQAQKATITDKATTNLVNAKVIDAMEAGNYTLTVGDVKRVVTGFNEDDDGSGLTAASFSFTGAHAMGSTYSITVSDYNGTGNGSAKVQLVIDGDTAHAISVDDNDLSDGVTLTVGTGITLTIAGGEITGDGKVSFKVGLSADYTLTLGTSTTTLSDEVTTDGFVDISGLRLTVDDTLTADTATISLEDAPLKFQIGANANQTTSLSISDMRTAKLGTNTIDISTSEGAQDAIEKLDTAIKMVSEERSKLGAYQNRLEHTINNLGTSSENLTAAESRIRDVDMAKEMMEFTKNNILQQAAQAMLAQANQMPQGVLQLLR